MLNNATLKVVDWFAVDNLLPLTDAEVTSDTRNTLYDIAFLRDNCMPVLRALMHSIDHYFR